VVFLWGDHRDYRKTLAAIKARENAPPVILTTSLPDNSGWIDRCEEGVAGYCVAPFHAAHVLGTMDTVLGATGSRSRKTMAAKH
jgi:DNA-binding response OmpR family regulator